MKQFFLTLMILALIIVVSGCKKEEKVEEIPEEPIVEEPVTKIYSINGYVQKGPFIIGTDLTISELNENLVETGRTFNTTIVDDLGTFQISDIELESSFVKIKADGYFYNEIKGDLSDSRIILYAYVDLEAAGNQEINVNVLTSMESERVKYLVANGATFTDAKAQAKSEIYAIFGFSSSETTPAELANIFETGEENAMLLAVSSIVLGTHTSAEMTSLVNIITNDLKTDGVLDNEDAQSSLINEATLLDIEGIKANLLARYANSGDTIVINNFDYYIEQFVTTTDFVFTKYIEYPVKPGSYWNLLSDTTINITGGVKYCFAAYLPDGTACRVRYRSRSGGGFGIWPGENDGWTIRGPFSDYWRELVANKQGSVVSIPVMFGPPDTVDVLIYENGSDIPVITKAIGW
jgi:hypothetical protein